MEGTVVWAGGDPCCGYGRYVVIQSRGGIEALYAHLETLAVRKGQRVRQGQALGEVGCTGRCFGRHLHFEVFEGGRRQNPMLYLP
jgi:murein DD-endopeptidase MepM/ murein hydrolase activator NlpD